MKTAPTLDLGLYVVTDSGLSRGRTHEQIAARAFEGGANVIQLRDKSKSTLELYHTALRLQEIASRAGALFIVNDRIEVALAVEAHGLHVGQDDLPADVARKLLGPKPVLGVSVENAEQAEQAERDGADYIAIGPIYEARGTKNDAGPPVGLRAIAELRYYTDLPIVAIGGIKSEHVGDVIRAGAGGIAVVSAVVAADDVVTAAAEIRGLVVEARGSRG